MRDQADVERSRSRSRRRSVDSKMPPSRADVQVAGRVEGAGVEVGVHVRQAELRQPVAHLGVGRAAVGGLGQQQRAAEVDDVGVGRIDEDELVVPALPVEQRADLRRLAVLVRVVLVGRDGVERGPRLAAVGRLEDVGEVGRSRRVRDGRPSRTPSAGSTARRRR